MTPQSIHQWFFTHFDRSSCLNFIKNCKNKDLLGEGRHFTAWRHQSFAICTGHSLPPQWENWMKSISLLKPQPLIPPFELIAPHTIVMPKLEQCHSLSASAPDIQQVNTALAPLNLKLEDPQAGFFRQVKMIYDWSDLRLL